jgi:glycosyltransferase involved in cell wall biosynthesis
MIEKTLSPVTAAFVNVSDAILEVGTANRIGKPSKHVVIPSGMDIESFQNAAPIPCETISRSLEISLNQAARAKLIVMVAALEPRKRIVEFLGVFREVLANCSDAYLVVLGEGPERERISSIALNLGLARRLCLYGFSNEISRWIARSDVCVLASEREGLPRAVIQYVACRRPSVVTRLPGIENLIHDGVSGYVVDGADIHMMAERIIEILNSPALSASMSRAASLLDLSPWRVENMTAQLEQVYTSVLLGRELNVKMQR